MNKEIIDFQEVTETSNSFVSVEQIHRIINRYNWVSSFCKAKDVIEVACGTGQGLNILYPIANSIKACDISEEMINIAKQNYLEESIDFQVSDAHTLPYENNAADIVIIFEAIYYLGNITQFIQEVKRVLRPNGELLISTANPNLYDFNPSPYSKKYFGSKDLYDLFSNSNFDVELFGDCTLKDISILQKLIRLIKYFAVRLNLIPKTMAGKKIFKKLVYGKLVEMPSQLTSDEYIYDIDKINPKPNHDYKVILARCVLKH